MEPVKVFYCYAREDEPLRQELAKHLVPLKRQGIIADWCDQMISPGQPWEEEINQRLEAAQIILLLISADFVASDYCYTKEMKRALERHEAGEARVIPIIMRATAWKIAPFSKLQCLPSDARAVKAWPDRDAAFTDVAEGIYRAAAEIQEQAEKEERQRRAAEAEVRRKAGEAEAQQRTQEEARRQAQEAEARRKAEEAEAKRRAQEEARHQAEEAEARRKAEEAEAQQRAQEEARRQAEEAEAKRRTQEETEARRQAEKTEAQRRAAETEAQRRQAQKTLEKQRAADTEAGGKAKLATPDRTPSRKGKLAITGALVIVFLAVGGYLLTGQDRKPSPIPVQPSGDNHERQIQQPSPPPVPPPTATGPAIQNIHGWPADKVQALQQQAAKALGTPVVFQDKLKDGSQGPEMVVIPGGLFMMGSPPDESQRDSDESQHKVKVKSFAIGKYEVTFEQYDRFAKATGRQQPDDQGWGRGQRPVINVSWQDAVAYANWLSQQTGQAYRLPTEAEWEYAARAGTVTPFYFGSTISTDQANYDGNYTYGDGRKGVFRQKTVAVGQFPANAWGLYDMHGNVYEWTCSGYDKNYGEAEGRCVDKDAGGPRVLRGGSWGGIPWGLRAASRNGLDPDSRYASWGFRLARTF